MLGMSGARKLSSRLIAQVNHLLSRIGVDDQGIAVGCCPTGLDLVVRQSKLDVKVFHAASRKPADLVARSVAMVRAVQESSDPALFVWPSVKCPCSVSPSPSATACFCGGGSGSWATAAFAAGLGVPLFVFGVPATSLPFTWPGEWLVTHRFGCSCFQFVPSASPQFFLFKS